MLVSKVCDGLLLNETLDERALVGSLMTVNGMKLLRYAQEHDGIKLTKSGALFRRCVEWAAEEFQWPRHTPEDLYVVNKVLNEEDFLPLFVMHELFREAGLFRKYMGTARLGKAGKSIIGDYGRLQAVLFEAYFTDFDFSGIERFLFPEAFSDYRHFLGVADNRLENWTAFTDYAEWCVPVYAGASVGHEPNRDMMYFALHRIVRPLNWLGLIDEQQTGKRIPSLEEIKIRRTTLFDQFIRFVDIRPGITIVH